MGRAITMPPRVPTERVYSLPMAEKIAKRWSKQFNQPYMPLEHPDRPGWYVIGVKVTLIPEDSNKEG